MFSQGKGTHSANTYILTPERWTHRTKIGTYSIFFGNYEHESSGSDIRASENQKENSGNQIVYVFQT